MEQQVKKRGRPVKKTDEKPAAERWEKNGGEFESGAENPLAIPQEVLKGYEREGLSFAWVRESCLGQPDPKNVALHQRNAWQTVQPGDFEDIPVVAEGGLILMCRPKAIEDKARRLQAAEAAAPLEANERRSEGGDFDNIPLDARHASARRFNHQRKSVERIPIPGSKDE
jgi:hypothetical protein